MQRANIAVCGCGPAGLAAALLLHRAGHRVRVFERFETPRLVGSGLLLQPTGLGVLSELGMIERLTSLGAPIDRIFGRVSASGRMVLDVRYSALGKGWRTLAIHRAALFGTLHDAERPVHRTLARPAQRARAALPTRHHDGLRAAGGESRASLPDALRAYVRMRYWHIRTFQWASALFTPFYQSDGHVLAFVRDWLAGPVSNLPLGRQVRVRLVSGMTVAPLAGVRFAPFKLAMLEHPLKDSWSCTVAQ